MGNILLLLGVLLGGFVIAEHYVWQSADTATVQSTSQDARTIASQMLALSIAYGHWHYNNPDSDETPDIADMIFPYADLDDRINYAVSGSRFWVWTDETDTPGVMAWLKKLSMDSKLLYRVTGGVMTDLSGDTVDTSDLTIPSDLSSETQSQALHLN